MASRYTLLPDEYKILVRRVGCRDGLRCRICKSKQGCSAHHIVFRSEGGPDKSFNLVTLCTQCHNAVHGKGTTFVQILAGDGNPETLPDADNSLKFIRYATVRRRIRWKIPK